MPCLQLLSGSAPQETQEESEHQQVPQKETLQVSIASEVRRPCAHGDRAFVPDERRVKFHLNPSVDSPVSSSPADTRRRRRRTRTRKRNAIARPRKIPGAKSASSPARRRRTRIKTRRGSGKRSERGSGRRNRRARRETPRSDQATLALSGFSRGVLKLPSPHRSPEITMKRSRVMTARRSGRRGSTPTTRRCRLSPPKATARPGPTR